MSKNKTQGAAASRSDIEEVIALIGTLTSKVDALAVAVTGLSSSVEQVRALSSDTQAAVLNIQFKQGE